MYRFTDHMSENWLYYVMGLFFASLVGFIIWMVAAQPEEGYVLDKDYDPAYYSTESHYDPNTKVYVTNQVYHSESWTIFLCQYPVGTEDNKCGWRWVSHTGFDRAVVGKWWSVSQ